jgi:hypothetical protein
LTWEGGTRDLASPYTGLSGICDELRGVALTTAASINFAAVDS